MGDPAPGVLLASGADPFCGAAAGGAAVGVGGFTLALLSCGAADLGAVVAVGVVGAPLDLARAEA